MMGLVVVVYEVPAFPCRYPFIHSACTAHFTPPPTAFYIQLFFRIMSFGLDHFEYLEEFDSSP